MKHTPGPQSKSKGDGIMEDGTQGTRLSDSERIARLEAINADLLAALELVEWVSSDRWASRRCPWCMGAEDREKHAPDCRRQKAIAKATGRTE